MIAAVARCRSSEAAALDNAHAQAENRCGRLEEGFVRERDRAGVAEDTALGMQARLQVSRGSGLAEQQQRQLEYAPVDPCSSAFRL